MKSQWVNPFTLLLSIRLSLFLSPSLQQLNPLETRISETLTQEFHGHKLKPLRTTLKTQSTTETERLFTGFPAIFSCGEGFSVFLDPRCDPS